MKYTRGHGQHEDMLAVSGEVEVYYPLSYGSHFWEEYLLRSQRGQSEPFTMVRVKCNATNDSFLSSKTNAIHILLTKTLNTSLEKKSSLHIRV